MAAEDHGKFSRLGGTEEISYEKGSVPHRNANIPIDDDFMLALRRLPSLSEQGGPPLVFPLRRLQRITQALDIFLDLGGHSSA
jgi:hypothetical protein